MVVVIVSVAAAFLIYKIECSFEKADRDRVPTRKWK